MIRKSLYLIVGFPLLLLILISGCEKEYSYEGGDVVIIIDTVPIPIPGNGAWICPACIGQDTAIESRWSFHNDSILICGIIDTAIVNPERTAFTFFGPSSCSIDTGMVISVFLDIELNKDQYNLTSEYGAFFYYDNVGQTDIYISHRDSPFIVTIESYIHQTRTATGSFKGPVYRTDGAGSYISSGKFKVKLF
jgi:hypothetical protein